MSQSIDTVDLRCPHLREVDRGTLQQLFSKVAAVRSENRELFDFTHRKIEVFRTTGSGNQIVGEDEVFEQFNEDRQKNFAVVIEGEVGTGKSELCAYIAHRLEEAGRPLLHVEKEDDLMTLLSERLPEFYREQFGEEMEGAADFQQLRQDIESIPQVVANSAVSNAILNLKQRGYEVALESGQDDEIREFIRDKLKLLVERGEYATKVEFVSEQEYRQNEFLQIFTETPLTQAVKEYNEELWRVVRDRYGTASLSGVLKQIGEEFTETRPAIVFEDFSITSMEADKLAKFIESDSVDNAWDFIVAGTRDSTQPLHTLTAESRYEFYQTNKEDSQRVLFLDEDSAVDFVRPYLGYFKSFDDSVRYDRDVEAGTFELLPAPDDSRCSECGLCDEQFRDLFPFNAQFLQRVYMGLSEDRQSPREYIMTVFDVLRDYYEGKVAVPSNADSLKPLVNRVSIADAVYENAESFAHLARWYGTLDDISDTVVVDRRFAEAFGLIDADLPTPETPSPIELTEDSVEVPSSGLSPTQPSPGGTGGDGPDEPTQPPEPTPDPVEAEFDECAPLIESWLNAPRDFKQTAQYLERGLEDAINHLTDDYALYEGTALRYNLSSQKPPFVFSITEETADEDQIVIDPNEFRLSDLRKVLRFGIEREKQPRSAEYDTLIEKTGVQLTAYARSWREQVFETNLDNESVLYKRYHDYDFADFVLAAYSYVVVLDSPWEQLSADALCRRFGEGDYSVDSDIESWLEVELEHEEYSALKELVSHASRFESMVGELFGVSGSDLDQLRIQHWFDRTGPHDVLSALGRKYIGNIAAKVKFSDGPYVRELANTAYDVRKTLDGIETRYQADPVDAVLSELDGISMTELNRIVSKLSTYDIDPDVLEPLKEFNQFDQSSVDEAVTAASMARALRSGPGLKSIQATLASAKLANSPVYERYDAVPLSTGRGPGNIGQSFREVASHYVE